MKCPYCGEYVQLGVEECPICNESLKDIYMECPVCAEKIPINSSVCPICAEKLYENNTNKISFDLIGKILLRILSIIVLLAMISGSIWYAYNWYNDPVRKAERMAKKYYSLAQKQENIGDIKGAIENYKNALNKKPELNNAKVPLVKLCIKDKDMKCVIKYIEDAYNLSKDDTQLKFYYATSIINDQGKSIPLLKSVIEDDPNNYLANKYVGYYYYKQGEHKIALTYLKKSFELKDHFKNDTGVENVFQNVEDEGLMIASIYIMNDEYTNAINILDQIINKTGNYRAKELKEEAIQRRSYYLYEKEREKAEAAARREMEAYNKSRAEYYREQGMNYY